MEPPPILGRNPSTLKILPISPQNNGFPLFQSLSGPVILSIKGGRVMSRMIRILHIDLDYRITYLIYRPGSSIRTSVPLQAAINLLKKEDFDLIISEPHNKAILKKPSNFDKLKINSAEN
jgi:hypothetical protein